MGCPDGSDPVPTKPGGWRGAGGGTGGPSGVSLLAAVRRLQPAGAKGFPAVWADGDAHLDRAQLDGEQLDGGGGRGGGTW